ncbi:MAG: aminoglycoside 6'-N-acetyltransferase [Bauldia sp.]
MTATHVTIRRLTAEDDATWLQKRVALWAEEDHAELAREIVGLATRDDFAAFGAMLGNGRCVGFVEVGARDYAEGCTTSPVGYVEGLWVDEDVRLQGIARRLMEAAADWSRSRGYREMASDTNLDNTDSQTMHVRLGFAETDRIVTFLVKLD